MSRSYKKTAWCGDSGKKDMRRIANSVVRSKLKQDPDCIPRRGKAYRKLFDSYEICDYGWLCTWEQYWARELEYQKEGCSFAHESKEEAFRYWIKWYRNK